MIKSLVVLVCVSFVHAGDVNGLISEVQNMLKGVDATRLAQKKEENDVQTETATFLKGTTDKVAAAVDQTLMGAAEERLSDKQSEVDRTTVKAHSFIFLFALSTGSSSSGSAAEP